MNILTRITYCAFVALISQSFLSLQLQAQEDDAAAPPRCHGGEIGYSSGADASSYVVGLRPLVAVLRHSRLSFSSVLNDWCEPELPFNFHSRKILI